MSKSCREAGNQYLIIITLFGKAGVPSIVYCAMSICFLVLDLHDVIMKYLSNIKICHLMRRKGCLVSRVELLEELCDLAHNALVLLM